MSNRRKMTRRQFLQVSALASAGALAAACGGPAATPEVEEAAPVEEETEPEPEVEEPEPETSPSGYQEAPMLAALVEAGELPPVDERLPLEPMVVGPGVRIVEEHLDWQPGEYSEEGEVLRSVTTSPTWSYPCQHAIEHFLNTPEHHTGPISGNLFSSWSVNDDLTEFEFTLRKGLKWSDGMPVTTEDIRFTWEDILMNEKVTPVLSSSMRAGGKPAGAPMEVEFVDDFTFRCTFEEGNGSFLRQMGMGNLWTPYCFLLKPKHYLTQFHEDYVSDEEITAAAEEEGLSRDEWHQLLLDKGAGWWGGGCEHPAEKLPVLRAWIVKESPEDLIIMERNPYYHKVDTEGKQLPYVDRIEGVVVTNPENIPAKIVGGEGNYMRERLKHQDIALYKENEDANDYRVVLDMVYHNAPVALFMNYNNPDENWREIVWQKEFRHALVYAINFDEIIDVLFLGMGDRVPWLPGEYDPDMANELLDQVGLDQRDDEGWRLYPNGDRFEFVLDVRIDPLYQQPAEVIKAHLEEVGIFVPMKSIEGTLWNQLRDANELYASIDWLDDCNWPYLTQDYMPNSRIQWAQLWHTWVQTEGEEGEEPPAWIKELYDIDAQIDVLNPNTAPGKEAEDRLWAWYTEYVPMMPLSRDVADPCLVPKTLENVATGGRSSAVWFAQEQVFFKH